TMPAPAHPGYYVFRKVGDDLWQLVGEADRRPGLPARKSRIQAIADVTGGAPRDDEGYPVIPRSAWNLSARDPDQLPGTDRMLPAGARNPAIPGPLPRMIPSSSVLMSGWS